MLMRRYREVGGAELCGGVPFFFNTTTGNSVCGAQQCEVLACISFRTAFRVFLHACKIQNLMDGICSVATGKLQVLTRWATAKTKMNVDA